MEYRNGTRDRNIRAEADNHGVKNYRLRLKYPADCLAVSKICVHTHSHRPLACIKKSRARGKYTILSVNRQVSLCFIFLSVLLFPGSLGAQRVAIRTNLLYWASTTPNVSLEWRLSPRYTLSATLGYNAFDLPDHTSSDDIAVNPKLHHWLVMPEARYWFCRAFERRFLGIYAMYGEYNAGGLKFIPSLSDRRYDGRTAGAGLSYGYQRALGKRWGLEASLGIGYIHMQYDKYDCGACGKKLGSYRRHYIGPTRASFSIVYYIR